MNVYCFTGTLKWEMHQQTIRNKTCQTMSAGRTRTSTGFCIALFHFFGGQCFIRSKTRGTVDIFQLLDSQ